MCGCRCVGGDMSRIEAVTGFQLVIRGILEGIQPALQVSSGEEPLTIVRCPVFPHQDYHSPLLLVISADVSRVEQEMVSSSIQESNCWLPDIIKRYTDHTASGSSSTPSSSLSHDLDWVTRRFLLFSHGTTAYVIVSQKSQFIIHSKKIALTRWGNTNCKSIKISYNSLHMKN